MDLSIGDFDTFVGVLARFTVAAYVVHATAPEGRVTNEHGAQTIEQMLGEAGLPTGLMGKEPSQKLLRLGGRERFHLLWAERIKEACAPLPPEMQVAILERFTAQKAWRQAVY